jgi:hypothetical protein
MCYLCTPLRPRSTGGEQLLKISEASDGIVIGLSALLMTLIAAIGFYWPQGIFRQQGIPQDLRT